MENRVLNEYIFLIIELKMIKKYNFRKDKKKLKNL